MQFTDKLFAEKFIVPSFLSQKYIPSLNGLRAISILFVIVAHVNSDLKSELLFKIFGGGVLGVHVFFVISGLLITTLLIREIDKRGSISLSNFFIRRFFRILPVAFLYIAVLVILNYYFDLGIKLKFFMYQITFTENFNSTLNWTTRHFWSISVEEQFYLLFPFLLRLNYKTYVYTLFILLLCSPVLRYLAYHPMSSHPTLSTLIGYFNEFLNNGLCSIIIGSLTAILLCKFPINFKFNNSLVGVVQIALIGFIWFAFNHSFLGGINFILLAIAIAIFIISTIYFVDHGLYKLLNLKLMKLLGVLSYSIYIAAVVYA